jgi:hypothetical protein
MPANLRTEKQMPLNQKSKNKIHKFSLLSGNGQLLSTYTDEDMNLSSYQPINLSTSAIKPKFAHNQGESR